MSGGHWDYAGQRAAMELRSIGSDPTAVAKWPVTCAMILVLADAVREVERGMDLLLSGDTAEAPADDAMALRLTEAVMKGAPDEWFPRGKWATIQAVQDRAEKKL